MKTFKNFLSENNTTVEVGQLIELFEHETYKRIPGTPNSYRQDPANTNTKTQQHTHVYAKPNGRGKELYSVNLSGSGHDGSSGIEIPSSHADFLRSKGYDISPNNILENLSVEQLQSGQYYLVLLEDSCKLG